MEWCTCASSGLVRFSGSSIFRRSSILPQLKLTIGMGYYGSRLRLRKRKVLAQPPRFVRCFPHRHVSPARTAGLFDFGVISLEYPPNAIQTDAIALKVGEIPLFTTTSTPNCSSPRNPSIEDLHPKIKKACIPLCHNGHLAEGVEKSFRIVRDRLRKLTSYETGSEAFGKGGLRIKGAAEPHVANDFNEGVKFLTMAIDRFRNEKAHRIE